MSRTTRMDNRASVNPLTENTLRNAPRTLAEVVEDHWELSNGGIAAKARELIPGSRATANTVSACRKKIRERRDAPGLRGFVLELLANQAVGEELQAEVKAKYGRRLSGVEIERYESELVAMREAVANLRPPPKTLPVDSSSAREAGIQHAGEVQARFAPSGDVHAEAVRDSTREASSKLASMLAEAGV